LDLLTHKLVEVKIRERGTYLREERGYCAQPSFLCHFNLKLAESHERVATRSSDPLLGFLQRDDPDSGRSNDGLRVRNVEGNRTTFTRLPRTAGLLVVRQCELWL
jgi:hypothetical protein